jgi:methyl-accepting chemotaxis protein
VSDSGSGFLSSIRVRLLASFLLIGLAPLGLVLWVAEDAISDSVRRSSLERLSSTVRARVEALEALADARLRALDGIARAPGFVLAFRRGLDAAEAANGPIRDVLVEAMGDSHEFLRTFAEAQGFADLLLLSNEGLVLAALDRDEIVGSDLSSSFLAGSALSKSFEEVSALLAPEISATDSRDAGTGGIWAVGPIFADGKRIGIVAAQLAPREFQRLLTERTGLGQTGEIIAAAPVRGEAFLAVAPLREDASAAFRSEFDPTTSLGERLTAAVQGAEGLGDAVGLDGEKVLSSWGFSPSFGWAIVGEQDRREAFEPLMRLRQSALATVFGAVAIVVGLALGMSRRLSAPLHDAVDAMRRIATGDLTKQVDVRGRGETRELLEAVAETTSDLGSLVGHLKSASSRTLSASDSVRAVANEQDTVARDFSSSTAQIAAATTEMRATATELTTTVGELTRTAGSAAHSASEGRVALSSLANSMERLEAGIRALSERFTAVSMKAAQIDAVVAAITKVANQTNLLAVNASIEAEKAGAAGLGFQIVANEIDRLATQTAASALEIESTIASMQEAVGEGMRELTHFGRTVESGCGTSRGATEQLSQIIKQVEELQANFEQLAVAIRAQCEGIGQVNDAMNVLVDGARRTSAGAVASLRSSDLLEGAARDLDAEVSRFRTSDAGQVHSAT